MSNSLTHSFSFMCVCTRVKGWNYALSNACVKGWNRDGHKATHYKVVSKFILPHHIDSCSRPLMVELDTHTHTASSETSSCEYHYTRAITGKVFYHSEVG